MKFYQFVKLPSRQAEQFHRLRPIAVTLRQRADHEIARKRLQLLIMISDLRGHSRGLLSEIEGQIFQANQLRASLENTTRDEVLQFPDVARPGIVLKNIENLRRDSGYQTFCLRHTG